MIKDEAYREIENMQSKYSRTPASKELPTEDGIYWATLRDGDVSKLAFHLFDDGGHEWHRLSGGLIFNSETVVAWMPIYKPEPHELKKQS